MDLYNIMNNIIQIPTNTHTIFEYKLSNELGAYILKRKLNTIL